MNRRSESDGSSNAKKSRLSSEDTVDVRSKNEMKLQNKILTPRSQNLFYLTAIFFMSKYKSMRNVISGLLTEN